MRRWIAFAAKLYPRPWRERYGPEFDALMQDVEPDWRELANVLGGAVKMQLKSGRAYWKLAGVLAVVGAVAGLGASMWMSGRYVSSAELQFTPPANPGSFDRVEMITQEVLSRNSLAEIIARPSLDVYRGERQRVPMEDVIQLMRRDIRITQTGTSPVMVEISFAYPNVPKAEAVVQALVTRFMERHARIARNKQLVWQNFWKEDAPPGSTISVVKAASNAEAVESGPRPLVIGVGILVGVLLAAVWCWPRVAWKLAAFAAGGCAIAGCVGYLIPSRYTSTAVMRMTPAIDPQRWTTARGEQPRADRFGPILQEVLSAPSLEKLIQRPQLDLYKEVRARKPIWEVAREMRRRDLRLTRRGAAFLEISFTYGDPARTQGAVRELVTMAMEANITQTRTVGLARGGEFKRMVDYKVGENLEVLDPASLPLTPVWPNRLVIAGIGASVGLVLGAIVLFLRRPRDPAAPAAIPAPAV
jgi:hypothetical protein